MNPKKQNLRDFNLLDTSDANAMLNILYAEGWDDERVVRACQFITVLDSQLDQVSPLSTTKPHSQMAPPPRNFIDPNLGPYLAPFLGQKAKS